MSERPGSRLASRPLHFIWIADCSESMVLDGKIEALNRAIGDTIPALRDAASQNPHAQVLVRSVAFSTGVRWNIVDPTPVETVSWSDLTAQGYTDLGAALTEVARVMHVPPMEPRALPPALVLISDGQPTDDWRPGLERLLAEPWGRKAVRLGIAIGKDADLDVLSAFIAHPEIKPVVASNARELLHLLRWASTVAARVASSPAPIEEHAGGGDLTPPPMPTPTPSSPDGAVTW